MIAVIFVRGGTGVTLIANCAVFPMLPEVSCCCALCGLTSGRMERNITRPFAGLREDKDARTVIKEHGGEG
jgi:hypothetical protein